MVNYGPMNLIEIFGPPLLFFGGAEVTMRLTTYGAISLIYKLMGENESKARSFGLIDIFGMASRAVLGMLNNV